MQAPLPAASRVVLVGCGASGGHTLRRLHALGIEGASTILLDTDKASLDAVDVDTKLLIAKATARGYGAAGDVPLAARGAETAGGALAQLVEGAQIVFVTTGLGGGTGTGAAPVVARLARERGALAVGLVSLPFHVERARLAKAAEGLRALEREADRVIVVANDRLLDYVPNLPLEQAFRVVDTLLAEVLKGIVDTLTRPSLLNLDLADVRALLSGGGRGLLLYGEARAGDTRGVVREALQHAFLDADVSAARGALVHLAGGPELTLAEAGEVAEGVSARLPPSTSFVWGARTSHALAGRLRLTIIATGDGLTARTP